MHKLFFLSLFFIVASLRAQVIHPDLSNKDDLKDLGVGRIIEKDNSIYKKIKLLEVKEYWIVYEKDESTHDMTMETIKRLEFPESKWGKVVITFPENKASISFYQY